MIVLLIRLIVNVILIPVNIVILIPRVLYKVVVNTDHRLSWIAWRRKAESAR